MSDPRDAVERGWREMEELDSALVAGGIDEDEWYRRRQELIVPAYLAADNPRAQSGQSGDAAGWQDARGLIVEAIDRDGTLLDIGCASGHLMETTQAWAQERDFALEPYGLELAPELVELARTRLPEWAARIWEGNALDWNPPHRFDFVHLQQLDYVPASRRRELVAHLLDEVCARGGRLILGPFNELAERRETEEQVAAWGYEISGRAERPKNDEVARRVFWVDAGR